MTQVETPRAADGRLRQARAEAVKDGWHAAGRPDAVAALAADPDLAADRAAALDLAYEEFCAREEAGEAVDSVAFCGRFPFAASLRRLIAVHRFLDDHPTALDAVPAGWPAPGDPVGDFVVVRELGRGGFSRVYLAVETTAGDRPVALKVSAAGSPEAATLGPLAHPHLVPVLSSRTVGEWTVVAMPFAGTATLEDVVSTAWPAGAAPRSASVIRDAAARGARPDDPPYPSLPPSPLRARMTYADGVAAVAAGVFDAVAYLHARGVAHRDLKPSNVLLVPTGHPYLLDLNLATGATDPRRLGGTLPYLPPEQLALLIYPDAAPPADARPGDVFACGVILFELLTGRHPFAASPPRRGVRSTAAAADLLATQQTGHPPLSRLNPRVPRPIRRAVERCLDPDPVARPTAADLAALFRRRAVPRRRWVLPAAAVALLLAAAAAYYMVTRPPEPPVPATRLEQGVEFQRQGQYGLAAVHFLAAARETGDGRAYAAAAYCLAMAKDYAGASLAADQALGHGYRTADVLANRAYTHLLGGRHAEALDDCEVALGLDPGLRPARLTRVYLLLQAHQKGEPLPPGLVADVDQVLAGRPNTPGVWCTAAAVYVRAGGSAARDKAATAAREAVLAGKPPDAFTRNAAVHDALKDHPVYQAALRLTPGAADPSVNPHLAPPASHASRD